MASNIEHSGTRPGAIAAALPAEEMLFLDLGSALEKIIVTGVCDYVTAPTKLQLREAFKNWYDNAANNMTKLTLNDTETYLGGIQTFSFRQEEAKEDRWNWSFAFVVHSKV